MRGRVRHQMQIGNFSEDEKRELDQLFQSAPKRFRRSDAAYLSEVRAYIEEHGRPPSHASRKMGTPEYRLRDKVKKQLKKKGRFTKEERRELEELL